MVNRTYSMIKVGLGLFIPFLLVFGGCGPSHKEMMARDHLANAEAAYVQAKENPNVKTNAGIPLKEAGSALEAASQAQEPDEMDHLAYIAEKKTQIAVATTEEWMAENNKKTLTRETEQLIALGREREQRVRMEARASNAEARASNAEARESNAAARESNAEALYQAQDAELARTKARESNAKAWAQTQKTEKAVGRADNLQQEIAALKGKMSERGIVLTIGDMQFKPGAATLSPKADNEISSLAAFMEKYPERNVLIEGHTDSTGTEATNLGLSLRRANAVSDKLVAQGVNSDRITTKGLGGEFPVAGNDTTVGRKQNRRVDVIILNEEVNPLAQSGGKTP
ncbi:MAG: OmpA family protein [Desulfobacterales bacterium]